MPISTVNTCIVSKLYIRPESKMPFTDWQANFHAAIAAFPGFVSLEIIAPEKTEKGEWCLVERFSNAENVSAWRQSATRINLIDELKPFLINSLQEVDASTFKQQACITEVFVTEISPDQELAYRQWIAKMHQAEAKFPGFRGVYVQSPSQGQGKNWVTLLQFDTLENLDRWLSSPERSEILSESKSLIHSLESHRLISPYAGWFSSLSKGSKLPPPVWKQTMIVLLVLFPIVMLEMKFLSPLTKHLNPSLGTFIGNAISVSLVSWPMGPIAIWFLGWWLSPTSEKRVQATVVGTIVVFLLYVLEVAILWNIL